MDLYGQVEEYLADNDLEGLKQLVLDIDPLQALQLIESLPPAQRAVVFRFLPKDDALNVFEQLEAEFQQELLSSFREERAVELFAEMDPDDQARLLDELPARVAKKLLSSLSPEERDKTAALMGYHPRTAGRIMTPEYVRIRRGLTVRQALDTVKRNGRDKETVYTLYVTDDSRRLEGVVSLRDLVLADEDAIVEEIMTTDIVSVETGRDQEEVARLLQDLDMLAVPVVDSENRLVGIITIDDAIDILEEETTDDIFDRVGLTALTARESGRSHRLVYGSLWDVWRVRIPFLVITLIGGMLAGVVIDAYEGMLEAVAAIAIFIPVIMDMGGNVGTQSSTIFTRAYVLGHISMRRFRPHLLREMGVGLSIGCVMGVAAGIIAALWQGDLSFGWAVGISLGLTMTLATSMGFLVPFVLVRLGFDQAAGSDPFITTIKDVSGLFIYFTMVSLFLSHLL